MEHNYIICFSNTFRHFKSKTKFIVLYASLDETTALNVSTYQMCSILQEKLMKPTSPNLSAALDEGVQ